MHVHTWEFPWWSSAACNSAWRRGWGRGGVSAGWRWRLTVFIDFSTQIWKRNLVLRSVLGNRVYHLHQYVTFGDHYCSAYTCVLKVFQTQNKHKKTTPKWLSKSDKHTLWNFPWADLCRCLGGFLPWFLFSFGAANTSRKKTVVLYISHCMFILTFIVKCPMTI